MKKSNWLILLILVAASAFFLWLWYYLQFNLLHTLDLVLSVVWWVAVAAICLLIQRSEKKRQERVRACYVGPTVIFNSEAGMVQRAGGASVVDELQQVISNLKYNFDLADFPSKEDAKFDYLVRTSKFKGAKVDNAQDAEAQEPETWEGEVVDATGDKWESKKFSSKAELAQLIA